MVEIISFPKNDDDTLSYTFNNITNIFELKKVLAEKTNKQVGDIFIYSVEIPNINYENHNKISNDNDKFYYKILSNRCACCVKKSTMITGDCKYCSCHYCNVHRLPESHCCIGLDKCKSDSFQDNYNKTINGKCVKSQIEVL